MDGVIGEVLIQPGDFTPVTACLRIADLSESLQFVGIISEEDKKLLSTNETMEVEFSTENVLSDLNFTVGEDELEGGGYELTAQLDASEAELGDGGRFIINKSGETGSSLPLTTIHSTGLTYYVYVVEKKKSILGEELAVKKRTVTISDRNESFAQIENSGLSEEDEVILSTDKDLRDGAIVRLNES